MTTPSPSLRRAEAYIPFDIGAEYRPATLVCPELGIEEEATEERIRQCIPELAGKRDPFAILQTGDGTYIQMYADGSNYDVEYQLMSRSSHYRLKRPVSPDRVVEIFLSFAFGKKECARLAEGIGWRCSPRAASTASASRVSTRSAS